MKSLKIGLFVLSIVVLLGSGCVSKKRNKVDTTIETYQSPIKQSSVRYSEIHLPITFQKSVLSELMNISLDSLIESGILSEVDGMQVIIERADDCYVEASERDILANIPLKITVVKRVLMAKVKAMGSVNLMTSTAFDIDPFWNVKTQTQLIDYQWTKPMKVVSGIGGFSIEGIANSIIENSKQKLTDQVDDALSNKVRIQEYVDKVTKQVRNPIKVDEPYNGYIQVSPDTIMLAGFQNDADIIRNVVTFNVNSKLHASKPEAGIFKGLPRFEWTDIEADSSTLALPVEITYQQIQDVVSSYIVGQTFTDDKRSITIKSLDIRGSGKHIQAIADVEGSFNGTLLISGIPEYDRDNKLLYAKEIDVKVQTKNVIQQAAAWLGKGIIKSKLEELLRFSLKDQMDGIQDLIDSNLESLVAAKGVEMQVTLNEIDIDEFLLLPDYIQSTILVDAVLKVDVNAVPDLKF